ncbi:unnamed protein product, partial [Meganyctiphanes norvegica]
GNFTNHVLKESIQLDGPSLPNNSTTTIMFRYLNQSKLEENKDYLIYSHQNEAIYGNNKKVSRYKPKWSHHREKRLPQVIIIGAKKCGTGALQEILRLHPQIVSPREEVHFFERYQQYYLGLDWYRKQMPYSYKNQLTLEKTPKYFITPEVPERIYAMNASIKLILIVRDPAERVISDYFHVRASHPNILPWNKTFKEEILNTKGEVNISSYIVVPSLYAVHISRWLNVFQREQIIVVDGDKLITDPLSQITKVESFLSLPHLITSKNLFYSQEKGFYCMQYTSGYKKCLGKNKGRPHPNIDPQVMSKLRRFLEPFNKHFYTLVGYNFSWPNS